jgi:C-terminal processing protease CtpA/Prc
MKKIFLSTAILFFASCSSIKNHNASLNNLIEVEDLKSDVDVIHKKMKDLHPKLYWYISEKELSTKFDSLKATISKPLTSFEFYKKTAPVVCAVREGHMQLIPKVKKYTKSELAALKKKGIAPLSQFEFELFNGKMYVVKNKSYDKSIKVGSEVVELNGKKTQEYLDDYNKLFTSDGFNTTFKYKVLPRIFKRYFTFENGIKDTINFNFKFKDSTKLVSIYRKIVDTTGTGKQKPKVLSETEKEIAITKAKALKVKNDVEGYDKETKEYRRNLRFIEKDSAVAIIKIRGFSEGDYDTFYEQSFKKIQDYKSKTLIIDLRFNTGGRLSEIDELYSYLSEKDYVFLQDSPVASKTSLFNIEYFKGPKYWLPLKVAVAPIVYGFAYFKTHKKEDGNYYVSMFRKTSKIKDTAFKGKIYVLINGSSFSASSIISSNLQGSKRAFFVGEETGGAYNGTVAGQMPNEKIPNSDMKLHIGLIGCIPFYNNGKEGRGIFPDKEIIPTLQDRIDGIDPELNWVINDVKKSNNDSVSKE